MIDYELRHIAWTEGYNAFKDGLTAKDNPYDGVSEILSQTWNLGWATHVLQYR